MISKPARLRIQPALRNERAVRSRQLAGLTGADGEADSIDGLGIVESLADAPHIEHGIWHGVVLVDLCPTLFASVWQADSAVVRPT